MSEAILELNEIKNRVSAEEWGDTPRPSGSVPANCSLWLG